MSRVLVSVWDCAALLRVSRRTVYRWIAGGELTRYPGGMVDQVEAEVVHDTMAVRKARTQFGTIPKKSGRGA